MAAQFDAIIIGAGPAGASAAILLARSGWRIALIEKQAFPRRKVCGESIAASNLPLLEELGVGQAFAAMAGPPLREVAIMAGERIIRAGLPPATHDEYRWGAALGREYFDTLLLRQAVQCGATVFQPWAARRIEGGPGRYVCHLGKPRSAQQVTLSAPLVIGAHGSWGSAAMMPGTAPARQIPHRASDLFAFKANFTHTSLEPGLLPVLSFAGGYGGMVVGSQGSATLAFCIRRDALVRSRLEWPSQAAAQAALSHVLASCRSLKPLLLNALRQGAWLSVGPLRPGMRISRRDHDNGVFLIGNAAAEAHPIIGEGMSMAIQSAFLLAEKLAPCKEQAADRQWQAALRQEYEVAWRDHFSTRLMLAASFAHVAMRPALAHGIAPLLQRFPQLLTHAARWSGKVRCLPLAAWQENGKLSEINNVQT